MPIVRLVADRILLSVLTLLIVSLIVFAMLEVLPGDVASRILGRDATPEALELLRAKLGLNEPAPLRYLHWLGGLLSGDFGQSLVSSRAVTEILAPRIYNTVLLSAYAFLLYLPLTILPALIQAIRRDRPVDHGSVGSAGQGGRQAVLADPGWRGEPARHALCLVAAGWR